MIESRAAVIGTPDDAVKQLERYWEKTGGFGCVLILAQNWANFDATKKSFELFARHVMPQFANRNESRTASYKWLGDNRDAFSGASRAAVEHALQKHTALDAAPKRGA
jgi:limonene 1,2-monooxygenase